MGCSESTYEFDSQGSTNFCPYSVLIFYLFSGRIPVIMEFTVIGMHSRLGSQTVEDNKGGQ